MKNNFLSILTLIFFLSAIQSCSQKKQDISKTSGSTEHKHNTAPKSETYYTCSMHPQVKEKKAGKCPICHMNLTKIEVEIDDEDISSKSSAKIYKKTIYHCKDFPEVTSETADVCPMDGTPMVKKVDKRVLDVIAKVKLRKSQVEHFSPEIFPVTNMKMRKKVRLLGAAQQSEEKESSIPARIGGRIEKVYVKSTGSFVRLNDPVIDLYSPKLITAGVEYILARESYEKSKTKDFKDILKQTQERLLLWGIKQFQLESWYKKEKVPKQITIYSSSTGIVRKRNATKGKYFKEGQNFFELSDLTDIWVEMDVYEHVSSLVKLGQKVELEFTSMPGEKLLGEIDFVSPVLDHKSRTLKVRTTIVNSSGRLKPGMVAIATLDIQIEGEPLVIPRNAVIDTGKRKVVWVKIDKKRFQAKVILTGHESDGYVEVKSGLNEGEEVVIEGNFMLDAQAQLFGGYEDPTSSQTKSTPLKNAHKHH